MNNRWISARALVALAMISGALSACQADRTLGPTSSSMDKVTAKTGAVAAASSTNGAAGQTPAYYEGKLFTVNMKEQKASASLIARNRNINEIYASNDLDDEQDFVPVINAIQGEGFNPLWRQNLIVFNAGFTPHQFVSEDQVLAAAAGAHPQITIVPTDEVYRCAVVGGK
jgi:hypothetical protein